VIQILVKIYNLFVENKYYIFLVVGIVLDAIFDIEVLGLMFFILGGVGMWLETFTPKISIYTGNVNVNKDKLINESN